ncbi:MAG: sigma-54-dependent transcriptional regulator [Planctomycetota bacterium]
MRVLIVDDEIGLTKVLYDALKNAKYEVKIVTDGLSGIEEIKANDYEVVVLDIRLPGVNGIEVLKIIRDIRPDTAVIVVSAFGTIELAVEAMKLGAADFMQKPFLVDELLFRLEKIQSYMRLKTQFEYYKQWHEEMYGMENLVGKSKKMQEVYRLINIAANTDSTVLIEGETGTGKEITALTIHNKSRRAGKNFVKFSCHLVPETLIEDELFGHEKGAYTDARETKIGKVERANGGTLFLDDIDDMPLSIQAKLLQLVQDKEIERIGGSAPIKVDIKLIAATKKPLARLVREEKFREDLFHRINVLKIVLPPLRERKEDIPLLVYHLLKIYVNNKEYHLAPNVLEFLNDYQWPGNVRELEKAVERAVLLVREGNIIKKEHLIPPEYIEDTKRLPFEVGSTDKLEDFLAQCEIFHLKRVLAKCKLNKTEAAELLGISRKTLWEKITKYKIKLE